MINLRMMNGYVFFKRTTPKNMTSGGIYIPDTAQKMSKTGEIISCEESGDLKPGDKILFNEYNAIRFEFAEEETSYWIMNKEHVMGVLENGSSAE